MSEMLVRVATAIRDKYRQAVVDDRLMDSMDLARAAIAEMRVPTEEMASSGATSEGYLVSNRTTEDRVGIIWRAMIDKALEE